MTRPPAENGSLAWTRSCATRRIGLPIVMVAGVTMASAAALAQPSGPLAPATFQARTVGDLAALCGARASDQNAVAAVHLCHGFLIGVGQYHAALHPPGDARQPLFCPPSPPPTVAQAAAGFTAWAQANPQHAGERAVDGLARWAQATYPCPAAAAPAAAATTRGNRTR